MHERGLRARFLPWSGSGVTTRSNKTDYGCAVWFASLAEDRVDDNTEYRLTTPSFASHHPAHDQGLTRGLLMELLGATQCRKEVLLTGGTPPRDRYLSAKVTELAQQCKKRLDLALAPCGTHPIVKVEAIRKDEHSKIRDWS